jgi:single-stranded-DNA-specific exonuclease
MSQSKIWKIAAKPPEEKIGKLANEININPYLATVLVQRGVETFDAAKHYFRPKLDDLHNPFLMKDMGKAVERLAQAIAKQENILIYGDYDVDGTTSVALVHDYLSKFYPHIDFYVPDRHNEGYGISFTGIDFAHSHQFTLVIALDCGVKSVNEIAYAKEKGVDFIVCDHHKPGEVLPDCVACLNPKQNDCQYPFKELSGCGIGFKLILAHSIKHPEYSVGIYDYLDLVAISIASDIVPMVGENRILTYFGLQKINERNRLGIEALIQVAGFKKSLNVSDVVFGLGPRINAAGRIKHAKASVELLISKKESEALSFAYELNQENTKRKNLDSGTFREAIALIEEDEKLVSAKSTVLFNKEWHKGIIGIVASKCIEKYHRPTIIFTESNNLATGSARSVDGFDLYEAIFACKDLLEKYGGHTHAAGLTLKIENMEVFKKRFEEEVSKYILPEQLIPHIQIDLELPLEAINEKFYHILAQMEPFGPKNLAPVFLTANVMPQNIRLLKETHLKFSLKLRDGSEIDAIGFGMGNYYELVMGGKPVDICYSVDINEFNGKKSLQLLLKDLRSREFAISNQIT